MVWASAKSEDLIKGTEMMNRLLTPAPPKVVIGFYLLTFCLFAVYSIYITPLEEMAGGQVHLDIRPGSYDLAEAMNYFETLGEEGRAFYIKTTIFDTAWPLCLAVCGFLLAPYAFEKKWQIVSGAFFPVAFGVLDFFENIGLLLMINAFPDISSSLITYSSTLTFIKQLMIPGASLAFFGLPIVIFLRTRRHKNVVQ